MTHADSCTPCLWARRRALLLCLLVLVLGGFASDASAAPAVGARLDEGVARIRQRASLPWRAVEVGREVPLGATLSCPDGCRITLPSRTVATLAPDTRLRFPGPRFLHVDGASLARRCDVVVLTRGEVRVERAIGSRQVSPQVVEAAGELAALWQGELEIRAIRRATGMASILSANGDTAAATGTSWTKLAPNQLYLLDARRLTARDRPAAPRWSRGAMHHRPIGIATDEPEGRVSLGWSAPPATTAQELVVSGHDGEVARRRLDGEARDVELPLTEGRYRAVLRVADAAGVWSQPSPALALRVLRVALPDGGLVADAGTVILPPKSSLRLLGTRGLEVALGKAGYHPARREVTVPDERACWLRFRTKGDPASESRFLLEQRELTAEVRLGPFAPVWPDDMIEAEVTLRDPSGRIDPASVKPRFRVSIGSTDVAAHFTFDGERWHARIPGRRLRRPMLLEVEVDDGIGHALGRAFLEVAATPPKAR